MNQTPKTFQIVLIGIFVVLFILGFLGFSGKLPFLKSKKDISYGSVTLWGTFPSATMKSLIGTYLSTNKSVTINYVQKNAATFDRDFIEALARGDGPDMVMITQDEVLKNADKLSTISYQTYPERDFKNTFIQEGELFLRPDGVIALPFVIDPIVMYWNRDIFTNALIPNPPTSWTDFYPLVPKVTIRDNQGNITRSLVAFGGYRNVTNAKEIVSLIMMQAGSPIVVDRGGSLSAGLTTSDGTSAENPVVTALRFFTEFSKSDKVSYSWNSSFSSSRSVFESGDLAIYFGYASEYKSIQQKNPHLNFDVAIVPQADNIKTKLTFGKMYGLAIPNASKNPAGAVQAALLLSSRDVLDGASTLTGLPPVSRELISKQGPDAVSSVFYDSALISRGWQDPSPTETNQVFMDMIDSVNSGRRSMSEALLSAHSNMESLLIPFR